MTALSYHEIVIEQGRPSEDYYKQFKNVIPEVGETYLYNGSGLINQKVLIISEVDKVVIGKTIEDDCGNLCVGELEMFYKDGLQAGWKYKDGRPSLRLKELLK